MYYNQLKILVEYLSSLKGRVHTRRIHQGQTGSGTETIGNSGKEVTVQRIFLILRNTMPA